MSNKLISIVNGALLHPKPVDTDLADELKSLKFLRNSFLKSFLATSYLQLLRTLYVICTRLLQDFYKHLFPSLAIVFTELDNNIVKALGRVFDTIVAD